MRIIKFQLFDLIRFFTDFHTAHKVFFLFYSTPMKVVTQISDGNSQNIDNYFDRGRRVTLVLGKTSLNRSTRHLYLAVTACNMEVIAAKRQERVTELYFFSE